MIWGVPKSAIDSTKANKAPALMPGNTSGKVTLKKLRYGPQPRFSPASSIERLTEVSAEAVSR